MALIKCKECGKEYSDQAPACPNCNCPTQLQSNPPQYQQYAPASPPPAPKASGLGIAALILSILGCTFILGLILAIIDLCRKDGSKKTVSKTAIGVCVLWILLSVFAGSLAKPDAIAPVAAGETAEDVRETADAAPSEARETEESKSKSGDTVFSVGDAVEYKDVIVTVTGYSESNGNSWGAPEEGNIFVFPEIEIVNNSDKNVTVSSMISFECYCDDYKTDFSTNAFLAISTENDKQQLDGSIAPGKKMKGVLGLEVPADWSNIEIYYKDNVWLNSNFSFLIEK